MCWALTVQTLCRFTRCLHGALLTALLVVYLLRAAGAFFGSAACRARYCAPALSRGWRRNESLTPCAGFLSPASRGALLTALLVVYLLLAVGAGFGSVWLWGMIQRSYDGWTGVAWRCAAYFPGITLAAMSGLNVLLVHTGSSGAIPLGAFFSLIALWFLISIPLCFSGAPIPLDASLLQ